MRRPQGYIIISDPTLPGPTEYDTFTCSHCQYIVKVRPLAPPSECGGWCAACSGLTCQACTEAREKGGPCIPWEKKMDLSEKRQRLWSII